MIDNNLNELPEVPASLPPEALDQLCDMIIAKLQARRPSQFLFYCAYS